MPDNRKLPLIAAALATTAAAGLTITKLTQWQSPTYQATGYQATGYQESGREATERQANGHNTQPPSVERKSDASMSHPETHIARVTPNNQSPTSPTSNEQTFTIKRILPIDHPIRYGEWHWNDRNVPAGPLVVTVDLQARVLSAFRDGYEIGATAVLVGAPQKPTPIGVFPILQKQVTHFSSLYGEAPMPYMQRLTWDGVSLHASNVRNGYASHGCIGMPLPFAKKLYAATHNGDKVIVTDGKRAKLGDSLGR